LVAVVVEVDIFFRDENRQRDDGGRGGGENVLFLTDATCCERFFEWIDDRGEC
jgi:hypothetical protein